MAEMPNSQERAIVALVQDLFFTAKLGETAKHMGHSIVFTGSAADFFAQLAGARPVLIIADLTIGGVDIGTVLSQLAAHSPLGALPILGYTTHADWKRTAHLHDKCTKVVTKDTLARGLPDLIRQMVGDDS